MRKTVRFVRNGRVVELGDIRPDLRLLDYLRLVERVTGTKAGCERGACGVCTVVLGRLRGGDLVYETVNACSFMMVQADGCEIVAIEDIAEDDGTLHPVQQALVEEHATQCGFCTPGMAMSLFALYEDADGLIGEDDARSAIQANLCRCTGYRPIVSAGVRAGSNRRATRHDRARAETAKLLASIADNEDILVGDRETFVAAPARLETALNLGRDNPDAAIIGGDTTAPQGRAKTILTARIGEMRRIADDDAEIALGAALTLADAEPRLGILDPDLAGLIRRMGGRQLRSVATIGGNVMAAGRGGDLATALIALGAEATLHHNGNKRRVAIEALYRSDGTFDGELGEILVEVAIPRPKPNAIFRAYKVAKRWDAASAMVFGAFQLMLDEEGRIDVARLAFSGLSPAPRRSPAAEAALSGASPLDRSAWPKAFAAMREDFSATNGNRASARYRAETAQALLGKALIEAGGTSDRRTRIGMFREAEADAAG